MSQVLICIHLIIIFNLTHNFRVTSIEEFVSWIKSRIMGMKRTTVLWCFVGRAYHLKRALHLFYQFQPTFNLGYKFSPCCSDHDRFGRSVLKKGPVDFYNLMIYVLIKCTRQSTEVLRESRMSIARFLVCSCCKLIIGDSGAGLRYRQIALRYRGQRLGPESGLIAASIGKRFENGTRKFKTCRASAQFHRPRPRHLFHCCTASFLIDFA